MRGQWILTLMLMLVVPVLAGCSDAEDPQATGGDGSGGGTGMGTDGTDNGGDAGDAPGAGDGPPGAGGDGSNGAQAGNGTTPRRDPVTWDLRVTDNDFPGGSITIQAGDTVRWTHEGSNPHSVTADDGTFDSHPDCDRTTGGLLGSCMQNGETFSWTFDDPGEVAYHCKIHGSMTGTITVQERYDPTPSA